MARIPAGSEFHKTYKGRTVAPGFSARNIKRVAWAARGAKNIVKAAVGLSKEAFYAVAFVERGTSKMPAQPWLVPSFEATQDRVLSRFSASLKKRIERAAKRAAKRRA